MSMEVETITIPKHLLLFDAENFHDEQSNVSPNSNIPTFESVISTDDKSSENSGFDIFPLQGSSILPYQGKQVGFYFKHTDLKKVAIQLQSAIDRVRTGFPTALAVNSCIGIGTLHGLILIFELNQVMRSCLGNEEYAFEHGYVSALSFDKDGNRILAGHEKGLLNLWDVKSSQLLLNIAMPEPYNSCILHIKYTDIDNLALISNTDGILMSLNFKRNLFRKSYELKRFSPEIENDILAFEPLIIQKGIFARPFIQDSLVALASFNKLFITVVKNDAQVIHINPMKEECGENIFLKWQFVAQKPSASYTNFHELLLTIARETNIQIYILNSFSDQNLRCDLIKEIKVNYLIQNISWLTSKCLALFDRHEKLHLFGLKNNKESEVLDLTAIDLVYVSSHPRTSLFVEGVAANSQTSQETRSCFNSFVTSNNKIYLLGQKSLHQVKFRTWNERINFLIEKNAFMEAMELVHAFKVRLEKVNSYIPNAAFKIETFFNVKFLYILQKYILYLQLDETDASIKKDLEKSIQYCFLFKQKKLIFECIFPAFQNHPIVLALIFNILEDYILEGKLYQVPAGIIDLMINYYTDIKDFHTLENCIIRVNKQNLNATSLIELCQVHSMHVALIYIFNELLNDYVSPLDKLLTVMKICIEELTYRAEETIELGNIILVYISNCLIGLAYPWGEISTSSKAKVKQEVYNFLVRLYNVQGETVTYPNIMLLLHFSTRDFINALFIAFNHEGKFGEGLSTEEKQTIANIITNAVLDNDFELDSVEAMFTFLARLMSRSMINVRRSTLDQIVECLVNPEDNCRMEERQQAFLELYRSGTLTHIHASKLVQLADRAKFYQVCEQLYEQSRQFDKILPCILQDFPRKMQAFSFIRQVLEGQSYSDEEKEALRKMVMEQIENIVLLDITKSADLLITYFSEDMEKIILQSSIQREILYKILKRLINSDENFSSEYSKKLSPAILDTYIELTCRFDQQNLENVLKNTEGYNAENVLIICKKYKINSAIIFLFEKLGDMKAAFQIFEDELKEKLEIILKLIYMSINLDKSAFWTNFKQRYLEAASFCRRNLQNYSLENKKRFWFVLMDIIMNPLMDKKISLEKYHQNSFIQLFKEFLNHFNEDMPKEAIFEYILLRKKPESFGEIRDVLFIMFESLNYEVTKLSTCGNICNTDIFYKLKELAKNKKKGIACRSKVCHYCNQNLESNFSKEFSLFNCGHPFHKECLSLLSLNYDSSLTCPTCRKRGQLM